MARRALLVGASGPIGYDYRREEADGLPYPVFEDLWGILLCYDELWFLSRPFCPCDMWELPYVHFLDEAVDEGFDLARLRLASEQLESAFRGVPSTAPAPLPFGEVIDRVTCGDPSGIDNHSRTVRIADGWEIMGNAGALDLLVSDMGVAAAMDLAHLDVLNNTFGAARFVGVESAMGSAFMGDRLGPWKVDVAHILATTKFPNRYEPGGAYVPDIEELRQHPNLRQFREMLSDPKWAGQDAPAAAAEITAQADTFARQHVAKTFKKRPWYHTLATISVGPVGNLIHPGVGSAVNGGLKVLDYARARDDRKTGGWTAFVASLRP
jgi:hypothetical protein